MRSSDPKVMRRNDAQAKEVELMPKPWRVPVARMY